MPQAQHIFAGAQTYNVLKRSLEDDYGKVRSLQNFILLSYGIFDWLSLDLKGGAGNIKEYPSSTDRVSYTTFLGGGYGFRLKVFEHEQTKMVFGFQHISIHPETASVGASKQKAVLDDWQFSFLASQQIGKLTPYLGTRWSRMDEIRWVDTVRKRVKSDLGKSIGLIAGTDIFLTPKIWLNIEGQFLDATAVAGSINFEF